MSDLRSEVIRLAHQNPELRPHLLPLLKSAAVDLQKKLKSLARQLKFPAKVQIFRDTLSYQAKGGQALFKVEERVLNAAIASGWKRKSTSDTSFPDGSNLRGTSVYVDGEGNELRFSHNIGVTAYDNWVSIDLKVKN